MPGTTERRSAIPPLSGRLRVFDTSPAGHFEAGFREIAETRMKGLPILNPRISVRADNFRRWGNDWIGTVVTPWSIMVVYACGNREGWKHVKASETDVIELPAGDFPFLGVIDPILGEYKMLGLMSPIQQLEDQATAEAVARIALETMLTVPDSAKKDIEETSAPLTPPSGNGRVIPIRPAAPGETDKKDGGRPAAKSKPLSRRDFFRRYAEGGSKEG